MIEREDTSALTELDALTASFSEMSLNLHEIKRRPTAKESFGDNCDLCPQSRDTQIHNILTAIKLIGEPSIKSKRESVFFHASENLLIVSVVQS